MNNISKLQKVQELLQARFLLLAGIILSVASYRLLIYFNEYFLLLSLITILLADLVVIRNKNIDNANRTKYFRMSFIHWPIS